MSVHDCGLILIFTFIIIMSSGTDSHMWVGCEIYQAVYKYMYKCHVLCSTCTDTTCMSVIFCFFSYIQSCRVRWWNPWKGFVVISKWKSNYVSILCGVRLYRTFSSVINKWMIAHFHHIFTPVSIPIVKYHLIRQVTPPIRFFTPQ